MPQIMGRVVEKWSGVPVANVVVNVNGKTYLTNGNGYFEVDAQDTVVSINVMHKNYETESASLALSLEMNQIIIELKPVLRAL